MFHTTSIPINNCALKFSVLSSDENLAKLADKETGLTIYADAISEAESAGKFRTFWLVLEAAFGKQNNDLIGLLTEFPPATKLGFTQSELK